MARRHQQVQADDPDGGPDGRMGFLEHLDELRTRLIRSCVAVGAGMLAAFVFVDRIAEFVLEPTIRILPAGSQLIFTRPGEAFSFYLNVALIGGVVLASPFVSYQAWRFIAPGLYRDEKKFAVPFVVFATIGTISGALFSHYVLFPATMGFFGRFSSPRMKFMPRVEDTFDQYLKMLLAMVIVFQLPTVVFFLAKMRLVTARFLWRNIKYAILIIFVVAAVLTSSPDAWNQAVFAAPMIALYLLSIGIAWLVEPKREPVSANQPGSTQLRLVFAATVLDHARRHSRHSVGQQLRLWRGAARGSD
jgi:sec-independent protein translocase protein TatC